MDTYTPGPKGVGAFLRDLNACDPACKKYSHGRYRNSPMNAWRSATLLERQWYLHRVFQGPTDINPEAVKYGLRTMFNAAVRAAWPAYCDAHDVPNDSRERILTHIFTPCSLNLADPFFYWRRAATMSLSHLYPIEIVNGWLGSAIFSWPWGDKTCPQIIDGATANELILRALPRPPLPASAPMWIKDKVYDEAQNVLSPAL